MHIKVYFTIHLFKFSKNVLELYTDFSKYALLVFSSPKNTLSIDPTFYKDQHQNNQDKPAKDA